MIFKIILYQTLVLLHLSFCLSSRFGKSDGYLLLDSVVNRKFIAIHSEL